MSVTGPAGAPPLPVSAPVTEAQPHAETAAPARGTSGSFRVTLEIFDGPFDLLLSLIAKHKLDVTEVALARVTDDFMRHIKAAGPRWDLDQTTEFLVVAATLLDLKAARLLPTAEVEDEEDLALLEARDLLFARLLQYRAYKSVAAVFEQRMATEADRHPRSVGLEPHVAALLPEVVMGIGPEQFAALAARVLAPKIVPEVSITHIHAPAVSVREQAAILVERLRRHRTSSFRELVRDSDGTLVVVARFLALLELFREGVVAFDQVAALGELTIRWTGGDDGEIGVSDEFDGDPSDGTDPTPTPEPVGTDDPAEGSP